jgi:hypothetical protein
MAATAGVPAVAWGRNSEGNDPMLVTLVKLYAKVRRVACPRIRI